MVATTAGVEWLRPLLGQAAKRRCRLLRLTALAAIASVRPCTSYTSGFGWVVWLTILATSVVALGALSPLGIGLLAWHLVAAGCVATKITCRQSAYTGGGFNMGLLRHVPAAGKARPFQTALQTDRNGHQRPGNGHGRGPERVGSWCGSVMQGSRLVVQRERKTQKCEYVRKAVPRAMRKARAWGFLSLVTH